MPASDKYLTFAALSSKSIRASYFPIFPIIFEDVFFDFHVCPSLPPLSFFQTGDKKDIGRKPLEYFLEVKMYGGDLKKGLDCMTFMRR